jgi:hypothetical protein
MKNSKTSLWLSMLVTFLVLLASSAGLFLKSTYARETTSYALQSVGQDIENIVAAAALLLTAYFVSKGSVKAFLVWMGVLLALIYSYVIYAFAIHLNSCHLSGKKERLPDNLPRCQALSAHCLCHIS